MPACNLDMKGRVCIREGEDRSFLLEKMEAWHALPTSLAVAMF